MVITLPAKLEDWNIEVLDELIKYRDVESETLDMKGAKLNRLYEHICAMANTSGGFIILGIEEIKSEDSKHLLRFKKVGYETQQEDYVNREIGNNIFLVEPNPSVNVNLVRENDGSRFYPVLEIKPEISKKPFFTKNSGQCYIRIENSSRPASRSVILNLCTNFMEKRTSVERLRVAASLLRESILHFGADVKYAGRESATKLGSLDLTFIRNAALSSEWFLTENNLMGKHTKGTSYQVGLTSMLYELDRLNAEIDAYNKAVSPDERERLAHVMGNWRPGANSSESVTKFLDKIIETADEFLANYK